MSIRILFVDPDECLLETYRDFFRGRGFDVVTATNGTECMAALRQFAPDAVVLEPDLPDAAGGRILEMMSSDQRLSHVPVLVLTRRDVTPGLPPVRMTLLKPISLSWLAQTIRTLVGDQATLRETLEREPAAPHPPRPRTPDTSMRPTHTALYTI